MNPNKKSLPYVLARDLERVLKVIRAIGESNSDIIRISYEEESVTLFDIDPESSYYLKFSNLRLGLQGINNGLSQFDLEVKPENDYSLKVYNDTVTTNSLIETIEWWVDKIKKYNLITFTEQDSFERFYENEFFEDFQIVDEDADKAPFDLPRQLFLDKMLTSISISLAEHSDISDVQDLITEANYIKSEITTSTKKGIIRKISKLLAKIRLKGLDLTKEVLKDYIKDGIKEGLKIAFEVGIRYISTPQ